LTSSDAPGRQPIAKDPRVRHQGIDHRGRASVGEIEVVLQVSGQVGVPHATLDEERRVSCPFISARWPGTGSTHAPFPVHLSGRDTLMPTDLFRPASPYIRHLAVVLVMVLVFGSRAPVSAQVPEVEISTASGTDADVKTPAQLRRLLGAYDLEPYLLTRRVMIEEGVIPHSHPVLTLNTAYLDRDDHLLATFLHEQFHWLEDVDPAFKNAMARFAEVFPDAPDGPPPIPPWIRAATHSYSAVSVSKGSVRPARHAGSQAARTAVTRRTPAEPPRATGSAGVIPKRKL